MKDPHKYTFLPPDPPRIPRQSTLTPVQAVLCVIGLLALLGAGWVAGMEWLTLDRLVGWVLG